MESSLLERSKSTKMKIEKELQMLNTEKKKDYLTPIMNYLEKLPNVIDKWENMLNKSLSLAKDW